MASYLYSLSILQVPMAPHVAGSMMDVINSMLEAPKEILTQSEVAKR